MNVSINPSKELLLLLTFFFGASFFSFWLLNGGAYAKEIRYELFLNSPFAENDLKSEDILKISSQISADANPAVSTDKLTLHIPKIGVEAPIVTPNGDSTAQVLASLEEGVGLFPDSALPGNTGRSVILGHSSHASWYRGEYATVFALLSKLEVGDEFFISDGVQVFRYQIFSKKILWPDETNILLSSPTEESEVDLVTCYPIGSSSQRTIVQGKLIK